jgi:hypothetical protein
MDIQYPLKRQKNGYIGNLDGFNLDPVQYHDDTHVGNSYEYCVNSSHKSVNLTHTNYEYSKIVEDSFERVTTCGPGSTHTPSTEVIEDSFERSIGCVPDKTCMESRISDDMIICESPIYDGMNYTLNTFTNHSRALVSQAQQVFSECCENVECNICYYEDSCVLEQHEHKFRTQFINDISNINEWLNNVVNDEYNAFFGNVTNILTLNYIGYPFQYKYEACKNNNMLKIPILSDDDKTKSSYTEIYETTFRDSFPIKLNHMQYIPNHHEIKIYAHEQCEIHALVVTALNHIIDKSLELIDDDDVFSIESIYPHVNIMSQQTIVRQTIVRKE